MFASKDGILYRLLVTERGYGNAIYLQHQDGSFTVYAHLQRFNKQFQAISDSIRFTDYSFEMDAILDTMQIEVKQGDIIGFTGSTGIGPPHLHFEVRDALENPINAKTTNLKVRDNIPPVFSSLIAEPLQMQSRIEGKPVSHFTRAAKNKDQVYDFGTIRLTGEAGLAVNVYDQANDVYNAYAVYSLALVLNSDTLFYEELNEFNYNEANEMFLDRIAPFGSSKRGHQRLYEKDGSDNPFYLISRDQARITAGDTVQTYTIIAADYFGNTSTAQVTIAPDTVEYSKPKGPNFNTKTAQWYWHENWASPDLTSVADLKRSDLGFMWLERQQVIYIDSVNRLNLARIIPGESAKVVSPDHKLRLRFGENAFFDTLSVASWHSEDDDNLRISIQPEMLATKENFGLEFYMGDTFKPNTPYRLFQVDPSDGELSYVDSKLIGRTIHAYPSELGEFTIATDSAAPTVSDLNIYQTDYGQWQASVHVKDALSGIHSSSAKFIINGKRGIAEYDYEEDLLIYYLPNFVPDSSNTAVIEIEDKAGNKATKIF